ncbi:hypothetical protein HBI67_065670 [Parastagonospora nodorum]|nr:hypothetical protein HBI79_047460 [Parastagonospora nodorum]KAH6074347.1 hypothetical protein HBI67_065670 [Parastagonospora nodorum]KAH6087891.1 hypothetical protein HBI66_031700 [Parastagonospora nodorum]
MCQMTSRTFSISMTPYLRSRTPIESTKSTENFVQWLADTARATGKVQDVFTAGLQEKVPVAGARLKGKLVKFAKDYKNPKSGNGSDGRYRVVGKIRHFEYLARCSELGHVRIDNHYKKPAQKKSPAGLSITVMADTMARDTLGLDKAASLSSLATLRAFKDAVERDEDAFNFDIMYLYLQCIRILGRIQKHCIGNAPQDFPISKFGHGLGMNAVINEMISHLGTWPHINRAMFPEAVIMLRKLIEKDDDHVIHEAKARDEDIKLHQMEPQAEVEPSFENPFEDMFGLEWRDMFGCIMFGDEHGNVRMPFG